MKTCYDDSFTGDKTDNKIFDLSNIPVFDWQELHGKTLKIYVYEDVNGICVGGMDEETKILYLLFQKAIEEISPIKYSREDIDKACKEAREECWKDD